jgi:hypothetical protein
MMNELLGHFVTYRFAVGPRLGLKRVFKIDIETFKQCGDCLS